MVDFATRFAEFAGPRILEHFSDRGDSLDLFMRRQVRSEEWFRLEILVALDGVDGVSIEETNRREAASSTQPDFVVRLAERTGKVELKVLPTDRNYSRAWQCFQAGSNNKKDFENLQGQERDVVIYFHWPGVDEWTACARNLQKNYRVLSVRKDTIERSLGVVTISYWGSDAGAA